eukprot:3539534-Ditylum_brightwellii.AAC.1
MDHDRITLGWKQRKCLRKPHGMLTICEEAEEANNKIHDVRSDDNTSISDSEIDDEEDLRDENSSRNSTGTSDNVKAIVSTSPSTFTWGTVEADSNNDKDEKKNITQQQQDTNISKENDK